MTEEHVHGEWDLGGYCNKLVMRDGAGDVCGYRMPDAYDPRENFNYHVLEFILNAGEGEGVTVKVECKGADKNDCACKANECMVKYQIDMCGWQDILKAAGDIPLGKVSARMDWTDSEEPWVEVEP